MLRRILTAAVAALLAQAAPAGAALEVLDVDTGKRTKLTRGTLDGWTSVRWPGTAPR